MKYNPAANIVFLDVEATGLHESSYPIEIGWAWCDLSTESHLIKPTLEWETWQWSPTAENIHHISPAMLRDGADPTWVARRLNEAFAGKVVCSDNVGWDAHWLRLLFDAADLRATFKLVHSSGVVMQMVAMHDDATLMDYSQLHVTTEQRFPPHTHRAAPDALFWAAFCRAAIIKDAAF